MSSILSSAALAEEEALATEDWQAEQTIHLLRAPPNSRLSDEEFPPSRCPCQMRNAV